MIAQILDAVIGASLGVALAWIIILRPLAKTARVIA